MSSEPEYTLWNILKALLGLGPMPDDGEFLHCPDCGANLGVEGDMDHGPCTKRRRDGDVSNF